MTEQSSKMPFRPSIPAGLRRPLLAAAALLAIYTSAAGLLLPSLIKQTAEREAAAQLKRELHIGSVSFHPFALKLTLRDVRLAEPDGGEFASIGLLEANVAGASSLWHRAPVIQSLRIEAPQLRLVRTGANAYNIDDLLAFAARQPPSPEPARYALHNIEISGGGIDFDDRPEQTRHEVRELAIGLPFVSSLPADVEVKVEPHLAARVDGAPFRLDGRAHPFAEPREATLALHLEALDLARLASYLPDSLPFKPAAGTLGLDLEAAFTQPAKGKGAASLSLSGRAALAGLALKDGKGKTLVVLERAEAVLDRSAILEGRYALGRVSIDGLTANLARDAQGRLNLQPAAAPAAPAAPTAPAASAPASFKFSLGELALRRATLRYEDAQLRADLKDGDLTVRALQADGAARRIAVGEVRSEGSSLQLQLLSLPPAAAEAGKAADAWTVALDKFDLARWKLRAEDRHLNTGAQPAVLDMSELRVAVSAYASDGKTPAVLDMGARLNRGTLALKGSLTPQPLAADLQLALENADVSSAQAYFEDRLKARLLRAALSLRGQVKLEGGAVSYRGDAGLGNLGMADIAGNEFLRWSRLAATGVKFRSQPLSAEVDAVALQDFFARLVILPEGQLNLQKLLATNGPAAAGAASASASAAANTGTAPPAAAPMPLSIAKFTLSGGRVRFSDRFIKPNYNATLDELGGTVSGLSSDPAARAKVDLHGEVNDAPLIIAGTINPLAGDLTLDLHAKVSGMELAPLSAYAGRYVGYGIERGKLSFDVNYQLAARKLTAQNRLVMDQLRFGEANADPEISKLPVHFALALLQDRNGVVDVNLPIEGSLDDPQFSIGGIVLRMIGNLIAKVATAPFTALASLFGGSSEELSMLAFDAGRAQLPEKGRETLDTLARALRERPALQLEITGRSDIAQDLPGLRRAALERKLRAIKQRDLAARGQHPEGAALVLTPAETPALLARAYAEEKFAKPKNIIGLAKSIPAEEMERLMLANITVGEDEVRALANRRAENVKDYLHKAGVPAERMYLIGAKDGAVRADFSLK